MKIKEQFNSQAHLLIALETLHFNVLLKPAERFNIKILFQNKNFMKKERNMLILQQLSPATLKVDLWSVVQ